MDAFQWLNGQLAEHVSAYLRALLGPEHGLVAHIQKAWPVVCARNGGTVDLHSHRNAAVSGGVFAPLPHRLLLFPSDLRHRVLPYEGSSPRYSVSYDLAITTAPGKGREMRTPHPMDWVPLGLSLIHI